MHTSLDGFTNDSKGNMNWIKADEEMFDYAGKRTQEADMALYGRGTYEIMQSYWPTAAEKPNATKHDIEHSLWYNQVDKIVVSRTIKDTGNSRTRIISENVIDEIRRLKNTTGRDIIMFGSPTLAHSLMEANLIDHYWLFVNPILLGQGIPLFKDIKQTIDLELRESKTFASGVVCLHYEVKTNV